MASSFKLLEQYLYRPSDLSANGGKWPSLDWMRKNNKRVIVFCPGSKSGDLFNEWQCHIENQFSTIDKAKTATERGQSKSWAGQNRSLYLFNFFSEFKVTAIVGTALEFGSINGKQLREALDYAISKGLDGGNYKGKKPNFIGIDFINVGDGLEIISKWNGALI